MSSEERKRTTRGLGRVLYGPSCPPRTLSTRHSGSVLGLNPTDVRCVDLLDQHGTMTAGALAELAGLSTGAVTFLLDRLERAGFVRRVRDLEDRRRVLVELVPLAADADLRAARVGSSKPGGRRRSDTRPRNSSGHLLPAGGDKAL